MSGAAARTGNLRVIVRIVTIEYVKRCVLNKLKTQNQEPVEQRY